MPRCTPAHPPPGAPSRRGRVAAFAVGLLAAGAAGAETPPTGTLAGFGSEAGAPLAAPWVYAGLPDQRPPATRYSLATLDGQTVLRVQADRSYGNLLHPLPGALAQRLRWRWRVDQPLAQADLKHKAGDDAALKVCALFDMPRAHVPWVERPLLAIAEAKTGQALPNATVCYVWDPTWPAESLVPNAHSRRVRFITLNGPAGQWHSVQRDLARDFLRAFGDEARSVPPLLAVAVGADADNTGGSSLAWLAELQHLPAPPP